MCDNINVAFLASPPGVGLFLPVFSLFLHYLLLLSPVLLPSLANIKEDKSSWLKTCSQSISGDICRPDSRDAAVTAVLLSGAADKAAALYPGLRAVELWAAAIVESC